VDDAHAWPHGIDGHWGCADSTFPIWLLISGELFHI
jgi:hypothetical protein